MSHLQYLLLPQLLVLLCVGCTPVAGPTEEPSPEGDPTPVTSIVECSDGVFVLEGLVETVVAGKPHQLLVDADNLLTQNLTRSEIDYLNAVDWRNTEPLLIVQDPVMRRAIDVLGRLVQEGSVVAAPEDCNADARTQQQAQNGNETSAVVANVAVAVVILAPLAVGIVIGGLKGAVVALAIWGVATAFGSDVPEGDHADLAAWQRAVEGEEDPFGTCKYCYDSDCERFYCDPGFRCHTKTFQEYVHVNDATTDRIDGACVDEGFKVCSALTENSLLDRTLYHVTCLPSDECAVLEEQMSLDGGVSFTARTPICLPPLAAAPCGSKGLYCLEGEVCIENHLGGVCSREPATSCDSRLCPANTRCNASTGTCVGNGAEYYCTYEVEMRNRTVRDGYMEPSEETRGSFGGRFSPGKVGLADLVFGLECRE